MTFNEILPKLFRNTNLHIFPGTAILASHLEKLQKDGIVEEADNQYWLMGS